MQRRYRTASFARSPGLPDWSRRAEETSSTTSTRKSADYANRACMVGCTDQLGRGSPGKEMLIKPDRLLIGCQKHAPTRCEPAMRHDVWTLLRQVLDMQRLEELRVFRERLSAPDVPATGAAPDSCRNALSGTRASVASAMPTMEVAALGTNAAPDRSQMRCCLVEWLIKPDVAPRARKRQGPRSARWMRMPRAACLWNSAAACTGNQCPPFRELLTTAPASTNVRYCAFRRERESARSRPSSGFLSPADGLNRSRGSPSMCRCR